jgi:hypothetical protein
VAVRVAVVQVGIVRMRVKDRLVQVFVRMRLVLGVARSMSVPVVLVVDVPV